MDKKICNSAEASGAASDLCFLCLRPSEAVCEHCGLVNYCSQEHLSLHRHKARLVSGRSQGGLVYEIFLSISQIQYL